MDRVKLEMDFLDISNRTAKISLDSPREDLSPEDVRSGMETIVSENIFSTSEGDLVEIKAARIITTNINELEI